MFSDAAELALKCFSHGVWMVLEKCLTAAEMLFTCCLDDNQMLFTLYLNCCLNVVGMAFADFHQMIGFET